MKMQENTMTDRMMKSDSGAARAAKPARAFRVLTVLAAALCATAALSCTADSENTRGDAVRISVSDAAPAAKCVQKALEHALLIVSYENGSEERIPLNPLPEGVGLSVNGTAVSFDRSFSQEDGETVSLAVSYAGNTDTLSVRNSAYQKPETSDPEPNAPETPEYITDVSLSFAQESYTEEQENILEELRVSVTFGGDGYSAHTKTLTLRELYDWLSDFYIYAGEYYRFSLYAGSGAEEELLFSFSSGNGFPENARIPLTAENSSFRWTLSLFAEPRKDYGDTVSVTVQEAGTYTLRLSDLESLAVPGAPDTPLTLTAQTIKLVGDISSGTVTVHYKKVFDEDGTEAAEATNQNKEAAVAEAVAEMKEKHGAIDSRLMDGSVSITKNGKRNIVNDYYIYQTTTGNSNKADSEWWVLEKHPATKEVDSYKISKGDIVLDGVFNYNEIDIENAGANISVSENAEFTMKQMYTNDSLYFLMTPKAIFDMYSRLFKVSYNEDTNSQAPTLQDVITKTIKTSNTPKLDYYIHGAGDENSMTSSIIALHKIYEGKEGQLQLDVGVDKTNFPAYQSISRRYFQGADFLNGNTMFNDNNLNPNIPNMSTNVLTKLLKYNINSFKNVKITGDYTTGDADIDAELTNVVFDGNVSGLKNSYKGQFTNAGVVYFMDLPYNNSGTKQGKRM